MAIDVRSVSFNNLYDADASFCLADIVVKTSSAMCLSVI